jgi:hypothetical protein
MAELQTLKLTLSAHVKLLKNGAATAEVTSLNRVKERSKARAKKFIVHHLDLFGLKLEERSLRNGDIMSVSCRCNAKCYAASDCFRWRFYHAFNPL